MIKKMIQTFTKTDLVINSFLVGFGLTNGAITSVYVFYTMTVKTELSHILNIIKKDKG